MNKMIFVYDQVNQLVDLRKFDDIGQIATGNKIIYVEKPTQDQIEKASDYKPNSKGDGLVLNQEKRRSKIISEKRMKINIETKKKIINILEEENKDKALIKELNLQADAIKIISTKILSGKYPASGEIELKKIGEIHEKIKNTIKEGRKKKEELKDFKINEK